MRWYRTHHLQLLAGQLRYLFFQKKPPRTTPLVNLYGIFHHVKDEIRVLQPDEFIGRFFNNHTTRKILFKTHHLISQRPYRSYLIKREFVGDNRTT